MTLGWCPGDDVNKRSLVGTGFRILACEKDDVCVSNGCLRSVPSALCSVHTSLLVSCLSVWERSESTKAYVCLCRKHDQAIAAAQRVFQCASCRTSYIINRMQLYSVGNLSLMLSLSLDTFFGPLYRLWSYWSALWVIDFWLDCRAWFIVSETLKG